jgi:hypothetical protein
LVGCLVEVFRLKHLAECGAFSNVRLEHAENEFLAFRADVLGERDVLGELVFYHLADIADLEWETSTYHSVESNTEAPDIGDLGIIRLSLEEFRSSIGFGSARCLAVSFYFAAESEVGYFDRSRFSYEEVFKFQVTVGYVELVTVLYGFDHFEEGLLGFFGGESVVHYFFKEIAFFGELHDDVDGTVSLYDFVEAYNVFVVEEAHGVKLSLEELLQELVAAMFLGDDLDCHGHGALLAGADLSVRSLANNWAEAISSLFHVSVCELSDCNMHQKPFIPGQSCEEACYMIGIGHGRGVLVGVKDIKCV